MNDMKAPFNIIKKVCILGNPAVGKTSLIRRFVFNAFSEDYIPTIGTKVCKKTLLMDFEPKRSQQVNLNLLVFDLLGQIEFAKVHRAYYVGSEGAIIVCDLTREDTISGIVDWQDRFSAVVGDVPIVYIGNKIDIAQGMDANKEILAALASDGGITYLYSSAKTGENVELAFELLGQKILEGGPL